MTGQTMAWPKARLGMAMLILTESVFLLMLIVAFVYFRDDSLRTAAGSLNPRLTTVYTAFLLASSITVWRGWPNASILLGAIFLVGQGAEYLRLLRHGITMGQGLFGTTFFTLTGIHSLLAAIGLGLLVAKPGGLEPARMYWHFIVAGWIAIFAVVYLWTFL
jgi:heme/copper-type cytochrome/quinol oxidase subunit 3